MVLEPTDCYLRPSLYAMRKGPARFLGCTRMASDHVRSFDPIEQLNLMALDVAKPKHGLLLINCVSAFLAD